MDKPLDMARPLDAPRLMCLAIVRLAWMAVCCIAIAGLTWCLDIARLTWPLAWWLDALAMPTLDGTDTDTASTLVTKLLDIASGPTATKLLDVASEPTAAKPLGTARPATVARLAWIIYIARLAWTWCQDIARLTWIVAWCIATAIRSKWLMPCWHQFVTMASVYDARLIRNCETRLACLLASHIMYTNE